MSFRGHGGPLPSDLSHVLPGPADGGHGRVALLQVAPGGFSSATQAIRELIDTRQERLDVMNPYFTDADIVQRLSPPPSAASRWDRRLGEVEQRAGDGRAQAPLRRPDRRRRAHLRVPRGRRPRQARRRRRHRRLRHREPRRLGALPQLRDRDDGPQRRDRSAHGAARVRAGHRQVPPRHAADGSPHPVQGLGRGTSSRTSSRTSLGVGAPTSARHAALRGRRPPRARSKREPPTPRCSATPPPRAPTEDGAVVEGLRRPCRASRTPLQLPSRSPPAAGENARRRRARSARR